MKATNISTVPGGPSRVCGTAPCIARFSRNHDPPCPGARGSVMQERRIFARILLRRLIPMTVCADLYAAEPAVCEPPDESNR